MNRTNAPGNVGGLYVDDDTVGGIQGTLLIADDRNAIQEELIALIAAAGLTPASGDLTQISQAVTARISQVMTAAEILTRLLTVDTDTAGINATTIKSVTPGAGGLLLLALAGLSTANPVINGVAAPGASNIPSRQDHVHPTDTTRLAASAYTAADVLAKLLTVDGPGSLLNSDKVDDMEAAEFVFRANQAQNKPLTDAPSAYPAGVSQHVYNTAGLSGAPWPAISTYAILTVNAGNTRAVQIAWVKGANYGFKMRAAGDDVWNGWETLFGSGNDGAGSGMDADFVRGQASILSYDDNSGSRTLSAMEIGERRVVAGGLANWQITLPATGLYHVSGHTAVGEIKSGGSFYTMPSNASGAALVTRIS